MNMNGKLHAPAALYPGKVPHYPLDRRLNGPQSRSRHSGGEKNVSLYRELRPRRSARSLVTILTELPRLISGKWGYKCTEAQIPEMIWRFPFRLGTKETKCYL